LLNHLTFPVVIATYLLTQFFIFKFHIFFSTKNGALIPDQKDDRFLTPWAATLDKAYWFCQEKNLQEKTEMRTKKLQIAVIGGSGPDSQVLALAVEAGKMIAENEAVLICGGLGGVMEAVARGAKETGGLTVGLLPDYEAESANRYIDVVIPTGLGHARNVLVAASGNVVLAFPGSHGTRSEISIALKLGKPVIGFNAWGEITGVRQVNNIRALKQELMPFF
jgi:uncharacterized protein (TIGR00725 family)